MAGRYFVTGVQLGLIKASIDNAKSNTDYLDTALEAVNNILNNQYICESNTPITDDCNKLKNSKLFNT